MDPVPTQYVDRDGAALAYQVVGDGPVDVVGYWDIAMHLDLAWTDPGLHHVFERGARLLADGLLPAPGVRAFRPSFLHPNP